MVPCLLSCDQNVLLKNALQLGAFKVQQDTSILRYVVRFDWNTAFVV